MGEVERDCAEKRGVASRGSARWWMYWTVCGVLAVGGVLLLLVVSPDVWPRRALAYAIGTAAVAAVITGVRIHRPANPIVWYLLAAGLAFWVLADVSVGFSIYVLHSEVFPDFSDYISFLAYPAFAAGLFLLIRGRRSRGDRASLLDASIISTGLTLLAWAFVMRPLATSADMTGLDKVVELAYPAGDVLLIALVARLFTIPGARTLSFRLLMAALMITFVSDVGFIYLSANGIETPLLSVGWLLCYVAIGSSALHPSMRALSDTAPELSVRLSRRRLGLLTAATLLAPAILAQQGVTDPRNVDWLAACLGATILVLLVVARMSGLVAQVQDQAIQLDALAHNDALTGIPNRRAWDLQLDRHLANARRSGAEVIVGLLDLDYFKRFNDQHGHQAGDRLLKEAAAVWPTKLRTEDLLARYGGDEFGVCIIGRTAEAVVNLLERVQAATPLGQSFSAGIAAWTGDESSQRLVARADEALYYAKRAGRRCVIVHGGVDATKPANSPLSDEANTSVLKGRT